MKHVWANIIALGQHFRNFIVAIVTYVGEAISQAFLVLFFSFVPFAALAFGQMGREPGFRDTFVAFFDDGQIAFFTFGVVGSVIWSVSTRRTSGFLKAVGLLCGIGVLWFSASALSSAKDDGITSDQNYWLWLMYIFIVIVWFLSMIKRDSQAANSAIEADDLIKRAKR